LPDGLVRDPYVKATNLLMQTSGLVVATGIANIRAR
jgi:hypothetical protein